MTTELHYEQFVPPSRWIMEMQPRTWFYVVDGPGPDGLGILYLRVRVGGYTIPTSGRWKLL